MSMGNFLVVAADILPVATTANRFGIAHVTVVPTNYDPDTDDTDDD